MQGVWCAGRRIEGFVTGWSDGVLIAMHQPDHPCLIVRWEQTSHLTINVSCLQRNSFCTRHNRLSRSSGWAFHDTYLASGRGVGCGRVQAILVNKLFSNTTVLQHKVDQQCNSTVAWVVNLMFST